MCKELELKKELQMYKQIVTVDTDKLRQFCINNRFYTHGDCEAYDNMFKMARNYHGYETEILQQVAEDIYDHSGYDELEQYCCDCGREDLVAILMSAIYNRCVYVTFARR